MTFSKHHLLFECAFTRSLRARMNFILKLTSLKADPFSYPPPGLKFNIVYIDRWTPRVKKRLIMQPTASNSNAFPVAAHASVGKKSHVVFCRLCGATTRIAAYCKKLRPLASFAARIIFHYNTMQFFGNIHRSIESNGHG